MLKSLSQGLELLGCFTSERSTWSVTELARELDLSVSTVSRTAATLARHGFLRKDPATGGYVLGVRLWELGCLAVAPFDLPTATAPYLQRLTDATGETSMVAVLDGPHILYLKVVDGPQYIRFNIYVGARARAFLTSLGKAILAFLPEHEMQGYLAQHLSLYGEEHATREELITRLEVVREQGWAYNRGEWHSEIRALAAPVRNHAGQVIAAIGVAGPTSRLSDETVAAHASIVRRIADDFSHAIGYPEVHRATAGPSRH